MNQSYPNIKQSFGIFGIYLAVTILMAMISMSAMDNSAIIFVNMLAVNVITIIVALQFKSAELSFLFDGRKDFKWVFIPVLVVINLTFIFIMDPILNLVPMPDWLVKVFEDAIKKDLWGYLTVGIVAPITEELLFRKVMLPGLVKNYGVKKGIIWSAAFFAIFHLNPWQGLGAFLIGIFLAWLYLKTQNIWLCIFLHWFNNSFSFLLMIFTGDIMFTMTDVLENDIILIGVMLLSAVCLYFCIKYMQTLLSTTPITTWNEDPEETEQQQP